MQPNTRVRLPADIPTQHGVIPAGTVLVVVGIDRDGQRVNLANEDGRVVISGIAVARLEAVS